MWRTFLDVQRAQGKHDGYHPPENCRSGSVRSDFGDRPQYADQRPDAPAHRPSVAGNRRLGSGFDAAAIQAKTAPAAEGGGAAATQEDKPLPARLAAADVNKGQASAKKCLSCHSFDQGAGAKVGPNLYGVVGRTKATFPNFAYSDAFKKLAGNWTYEDLDKFLTKRGAFAAGTKMTFAGLPSGAERADVIAYLRSISPQAPPPPQ